MVNFTFLDVFNKNSFPHNSWQDTPPSKSYTISSNSLPTTSPSILNTPYVLHSKPLPTQHLYIVHCTTDTNTDVMVSEQDDHLEA